MPIQPGADISRYHILEQLGEGGMAVVYKAYDTRLESEVAIKFIRTDQFPPAQLEKVLKRFQSEARNMAKLTHANIVKVNDYGEYEGSPFLVMPFLPGGNLKDRLGKPLPWQEAVLLLIPITRALTYAHQCGLVHRDVKPSNILITESGDPMLSDFGIAKILETEETLNLTTTGMGIGTPEYMAPEQWLNQVSNKTDIYALGVVLYELVTGKKPYTADTPAAVLLKQSNDPLPRPRDLVRDLPSALEKVIFKALAKQPRDRYADMPAFTKVLEGLLKSEGKEGSETPDHNPAPHKETLFDTKEEHKRNEVPAILNKKGIPGWIWGVGGLGLLIMLIGLFALKGGSSPAVILKPNPTPTQESTLVPTSTTMPTPTLGIGSSMVSEKDGMTLMYVPEGEFIMGSDNGYEDEKPEHTVYLDAFWIDKTEVTNTQYRLCVEVGVCNKPPMRYFENKNYLNHPIVYMSWNDANDYCGWVGRRLPTEAEWEKAARGIDQRTYPWGEGIDCNKANYGGCKDFSTTSPVGYYASGASPYGVFDMIGNVTEWVSDWYSETYYSQSPLSNPKGPTSGDNRVQRGSAWDWAGGTGMETSFNRIGYLPYEHFYKFEFWQYNAGEFGFRCAMSATE